jgi:hypothetical protein
MSKITATNPTGKCFEMRGRKVIRLWDSTIWTIKHEAWGKFFIENNFGFHTRVEKNEVILINE